jgi:hypothetical protein
MPFFKIPLVEGRHLGPATMLIDPMDGEEVPQGREYQKSAWEEPGIPEAIYDTSEGQSNRKTQANPNRGSVGKAPDCGLHPEGALDRRLFFAHRITRGLA